MDIRKIPFFTLLPISQLKFEKDKFRNKLLLNQLKNFYNDYLILYLEYKEKLILVTDSFFKTDLYNKLEYKDTYNEIIKQCLIKNIYYEDKHQSFPFFYVYLFHKEKNYKKINDSMFALKTYFKLI